MYNKNLVNKVKNMPVSKISIITVKPTGNAAAAGGFQVQKADDETLKNLAWAKPAQDIRGMSKSLVKIGLVGIPVVDTLLSGAAHRGNLSTKLAKSASTAGKYALAFTAGAVVFGLKNAINKKSEKLNNFDKNHPSLSFAADLAAVFTAFAYGKKGINKVSEILKLNGSNAIKSAKTTVKNALNNSFVNTKFVKPLETKLANNPYADKALKTVAAASVPIMFISALMGYNKGTKSAIAQANENYSALKSLNDAIHQEAIEDAEL